VSYPVWDSYLIYMGSLFWGTVTPGRVGDFMKVLYLKRDRAMSIGKGMSSVLVDRVFDLYILLILGCLGLLIHPLPDNPNPGQGGLDLLRHPGDGHRSGLPQKNG
jgi:uncharacterized protein (TIRG00374 family)